LKVDNVRRHVSNAAVVNKAARRTHRRTEGHHREWPADSVYRDRSVNRLIGRDVEEFIERHKPAAQLKTKDAQKNV